MCDVRIIETAYDMTDGIGQSDIGQELIAQTFSLAGSLDQSGNIGKFESCINGLFRMKQLHQTIHAGIRHFHDADIRLDRRKRIVGCFYLTFCDCIE